MASRKGSSKPMGPLSANTQGPQRTNLTTLGSTTSPRTGRETQRNNETRAIFAGTPAYTQYGVEETFDPAPQKSKHPTYPRAIDHHDFQTEGAHTVGESSMEREHHTARMDEALQCPYHGPILQGRPTNTRPNQGFEPMDRYIAEGPSERYAILHRPDNQRVATHNGCRCFELAQSGADAKDKARN